MKISFVITPRFSKLINYMVKTLLKARIGIIGGSGFYELLEKAKPIILDTPFGKTPVIHIGKIGKRDVAFLARHSKPGLMTISHAVPPHKINFRANIYGLCMLGVERILSSSAVGSLNPDCPPGTLVIPDQILDFTKNRIYTFYDGNTEIVIRGEKKVKGVVHIDVSQPFCPELRRILRDVCDELNVEYHFGGTYVCTEGPRYETPAEIKAFRMLGGDIVGMTVVPEAFLARELEICYATLSVVTNWAAGIAKHRLTAEEVVIMFKRKIEIVKKVFIKAIELIPDERQCPCKSALEKAIV